MYYLNNTKCSEESSNSNCNSSFKCIMNDNDSGYISQHVESNSLGEVSDFNNYILFSNSNMYLNEDTLLENPVQTQAEHENLFYMSDFSNTIIPPSVSSQGDSFHVFDSEDSEVIEETEVSLVIPVADPIVVSDTIMEKVTTIEEGSIGGSFIVDDQHKDNKEDFKDSSIELNLFKHSSQMDDESDDKTGELSTLKTNNLSCVQTRIRDANNCNMSLFESFYSFVCDLYTKDQAPLEETSSIVNPRDLCVTQVEQSSSYIQLESRSTQDLPLDEALPTIITSNLESPTTLFLNPIHPEESSSAPCSPIIATNNPEKVDPIKVMKNSSTSVVSPEKVKPPVDSPNFVGAFNSVDEREINSSDSVTNVDNSLCPSESVSKFCESPKITSSLMNDSSESGRPKNIANVSTKTTTITDRSAIIAKAKELSKIDTKQTDSLRGRNSLAGSNMLRTKLRESRNATPTKSILKKRQRPDSSPELFSDEEFLESRPKPVALPVHKEHNELYITQTDRKLLQRAQESISGVLPPPSVTILQITIEEMLGKLKENENLFWNNTEGSSNNEGASTSQKCESPPQKESLLVRCKKTDFNPEAWPDILNHRYHGLHFNRNTLSEDFESLCTKYSERCIGAETQSSCTVFGINAVQSPSKHRCRLKRTAKSPGKRLSHLATMRKITFSKDSLNSSASGRSGFIGARTRQIMIDVRKCQMVKHKSPRKKTPVKSPRKKLTPSSSARKRFSRRLRMYNIDDSNDSVASTSTSASNSKLSATKRALFQSPSQRSDNGSSTQSHSKDVPSAELTQSARRRTPRRALFPSPLRSSPTKMTISSLYPPKRKLTPKRALFTSPEKSLRSSSANDRKRKRADSDCEQPSKVVNSLTEDMKKGTGGVQNATKVSTSTVTSQNITDNRNKKLMWAVSQALRSQNIDLKHPQFKVYASMLAQVIRKCLPNLFINGLRSEGGTTESMLRIAKKYVFSVTRGKSVENIMKEAENEKLRGLKPRGYVGVNKIECGNSSQSKHKEGVLQDRLNIISTENDVTENNKNVRRGGNVERIRKVINFGDDDVKSTSVR